MAIEEESFSKLIQIGDMSSNNMTWGTTWEVEICKNPGFFYMEKAGWNRFVRDNSLGGGDLLTFTHKGAMCFTVKIFKEMLQLPHSTALFASFSNSRNRTEEQGEDVNKEAESNGGRKNKRKLEKVVSVPKDSGGPSSSTGAGFSVFISSSYLGLLAIKQSFAKDHMPATRATFTIHHPDQKKSWSLRYLPRTDPCVPGKWSPCFSAGWKGLLREYIYTHQTVRDASRCHKTQRGNSLKSEDDGCEGVSLF